MTSPLFEAQSTGGVTARGGFEYQDSYLLQQIPLYLSQGAFSHVVSELVGDIEVRYHRPAGGTYCVTYEAKGYQLSEKELWDEIDRFLELYGEAKDEYVQFVLVCTDYLSKLDALLSKLKRLRGPGASLNTDSAFRNSAEADILESIVKLGRSREIAQFVLDRVSFIKYNSSDVSGGFVGMLTNHLPTVADMKGREQVAFQAACKQLVDSSINGCVTRVALEAALVESAPSIAMAWMATPTTVYLTAGPVRGIEDLALNVADFNGDSRGALGAAAWRDLQHRLVSLGTFIKTSRMRQAIKVSAKQRMSLACLVGFVFSATRGFTLQMEHNDGQSHDTAKHDRATISFFTEGRIAAQQDGIDGVVSISFPTSSREDVLASTSGAPLEGAPKLFLESTMPVGDSSVLNTAVADAKDALVAFRGKHQLERIHLFVKAPSFFAMTLGHRLNGVGEVLLYDWVGGSYQQTAKIS